MIKTFTASLFTILLSLLAIQSQAQSEDKVQFKVELLANNTYQVSLRSGTNWNAPLNITNSAAVTLVVPTGGFEVNSVTDISGNWERIAHVVAPEENPSMDYFIFTLQSGTSDIVYSTETTSILFSFINDGSCTGALELINNDTDPFMTNSQNILAGNQISLLGAGPGVNAYESSYAAGSADCSSVVESGCGITITNVLKTSPSTCGVADGVIEIVASQTGALPPLQYSIDDGDNWQASPVFPDLAAGDEQVIVVRDMAALCRADWGPEQLDAPLAAAIRRVDVNHPSTCGGTDGSFFIDAFNEFDDELQFSVDEGATWQFDSLFTGLAAGTYNLVVRNNVNNCISEIGQYILTEDCSNEVTCLFEFEIEEIGDRTYDVSLIPNVTYNFPNNITSTAQVTMKVPTGGFVMSNLQSLVDNVSFVENSTYEAPEEDPNFDYITIGLGTQGTTNISYQQGVKVGLFTFENTGTCTGDSIYLMNNATDPFFPPNSESAGVGMQITTAGSGADAPLCLRNNGAAPCSGLDIVCMDVSAGDDVGICAGGQVQLQATSGAGNYVWSPAEGLSCTSCPNPVASPNAPTTYTVTSDDGTCMSSDMVEVAIIDSPKPDFFVTPPCDGEAAEFLYQANGPTDDLTWLWDFGDNGATSTLQNPTYTFSGPGDYTVTLTVTANGACSGDISQVITVHANAVADAGQDVSVCDGENIQLNATGGTLYTWSPAEGLSCTDCPNPVAQPASTTTYTVLVSNENDCSDTDEITVSVGTSVSITTVNGIAPSDCSTGGRIEISANCAAACNLEYSIDNGQSWSSNANFTDVAAGQYNVQVRVENTDCIAIYDNNPVDISTADSPQISEVTSSHPATCGSATGSISITADCTDACTLEYSIDNGQSWHSNANFANLAAGQYHIQVRVENTDCVTIHTNNPVTIQDGDAPNIDEVTSSNPATCDGGAGSISITASCIDACNLEYSIDNGQSWSSNANFSDVAAGQYNVQVRVENSDCVSSYNNNPINISAANGPQIDNVSTTDPSTCGATDGMITITASGGTAPLQYSIDGGNNFQSSPEFTDLFPAAYSVVVANADEGCPITHNEAVIINPTALNNTISVEAEAPSDCELSDGRITVTANPADNIEYSIDGGVVWTPNPVFENLPSGSYYIKIRVAGGFCSADYEANPVVLVQPNPPTVFTPLDEFTTCEGVTVPIEIVINQAIDSFRVYGNGGYLNDVLDGSTITFDAVATDDISNFHIEIYGTSGCSITESFQIFRIDAPVADFEISEPVCTGGETTIMFTGIASADAILDWTLDGAELISSSPATATEPAGTVLNVRWASQGNKTVELFVQDGACEATMNEDISVIPFPIAVNTFVENASGCGTNDGSINLVILNDEPYNFAWSSPNGFTAQTQNISGLSGGDYTVTITDMDAGCTLELNATVDEPSNIFIGNITTVDNASCDNASGQVSVSISGGNPPYTFELLENGTSIEQEISFDNNYTFENLTEGNYSLVVNDLNDCSDSENVTVNSANANPPSITIVDVQASSCGTANGRIEVDVTGSGISYSYELFRNVSIIASGDLPVSNQIIFNDLEPATYTVVITDNNNCSDSEEVTITSEAATFEVDAAISAPSCDVDNGSIVLSNFPANSNFTWDASNGAILPSSNEVTGLASGVYFVTVSDANGCSESFNYSLEPSDGPQVVIQDIRDIVCGGLNSGAVYFEVESEGTFDYDIMGQDITGTVTGNSLDSIVNLTAGGYILNITNTATNCATSVSFLIEEGNALQVIAVASPATECYVFDGTICLNISGGMAPYTIEANKGSIPEEPVFGSACIEELYDGVVDIKVIDDNGCAEIFRISFNDVPTCSDTLFATIPANELTELCFADLMQLPGEVAEASICYVNDNELDVNLEGVETCVDVTPTEGFVGTAETVCIIHCQDIFDNTYCDTTYLKLTVEEEDIVCALMVEGRTSNEATCDETNGSASLQVIGNIGTLQYNWSNELPNSNTIENLAEGTYYVTITDEMTACSITDSVVIGNIPGGVLSLTAQEVSCSGSGAIEANMEGGTAPFNIQWSGAAIGSFMDVQFPYTIPNLAAGDYEIEIQDAYNCIAIQSITIAAQVSNLSIATETLSGASCNADNAIIQLTVDDFSESYSVEIDGEILFENETQESLMIENLSAGLHNIIVTDNSMCSDDISVLINNEESDLSVLTQVVHAPSCGTDNGVAQLNINDFSGSYTVEVNGVVMFENQQEAVVLLEDLAAGEYLIVITDEATCSTGTNLSLFESGTNLDLDIEVATMPECEAMNGQLMVSVSNYFNSYDLSVNGEVMFSNMQADFLLVENLMAGSYDIAISDEAGCLTEMNIVLESIVTPGLTLDNVIVKQLNCSDDSNGGIESALIYPLMVFDLENNLIGETPVTGLVAGDYMVRDNAANCPSELVITINDIADWAIDTTITPTTCEGNDGEISLVVSGANGNYTFEWSPAVSDSSSAVGLSADSTYSVIITDDEGCSHTIENLLVSMDCDIEMPECDPLFALDTFLVAITDSLTQICLPLTVLDTTGWTYVLDGTSYEEALGTCIESGVFYSYGALSGAGEAPYRLESWTYNNNEISNFEFNTIEELVAEMNAHDPLGNWLISNTDNSISGGTAGVNYGNLQITHIESNTTWDLPLNNVSQTRFAISVAGVGQHQFVIEDGNCSDTLIINLWQDEPERPEIFLEEFITLIPDTCGGIAKLCLPFDNVLDFDILIDNDPFLDEFLDCDFDDPALPLDTGFHEIIITDIFNDFSDTVIVNVMCDTLNAPISTIDTMFVEMLVNESVEVCMDISELPGFLLSVQNTCEDPLDQVADVLTDIDECVDVFSYEVGESQACMVLCNELGFCDTTIVIITVTTDEPESRELIIYNGFSPNDDGINDHFYIENIEFYPNNSLKIFNRWGSRVYQTEGYRNKDWGGTFADEKQLPDGTYFYILEDGEGREFKGFLEIRR